MIRTGVALRLSFLALAAWLPASAQSVISTHSGVLYFFEGSVSIGGEQVQQKFGKFPEIGNGGELRTEQGRAEVLLTPGVFLRLSENSAMRLLSNQLSDTRVELLAGSAILEAEETSPGTSARLIYKNWQVRVPQKGVYRIDSEPPQLKVYKGEVQVSSDGKTETATAREGETLPLAAVLVAEPSANPGADDFKSWAMSRSDAITADNTIAAGITDDPSQIDSSGLALGGFTYFPATGIPSLGITNPYGLSFWSPYQSMLSSIYFPTYLYYGGIYSGWPSGIHPYLRPILPPRYGTPLPRTPTPRIPPGVRAPVPAPHAGVHVGGHR